MISVPNVARIVWESHRAFRETQRDPDHVCWEYLTKGQQDKMIERVVLELQGKTVTKENASARDLVEDALLAGIAKVFSGNDGPEQKAA